MKQKLLDELMEVSEEEQKYLDGQGDIERQLYVKDCCLKGVSIM